MGLGENVEMRRGGECLRNVFVGCWIWREDGECGEKGRESGKRCCLVEVDILMVASVRGV